MNATNDVPPELREADRIASQAVAALMEHVDSVTIFITKRSEFGRYGTCKGVFGGGDFFARYGRAKEWVLQCEADMKHPPASDND